MNLSLFNLNIIELAFFATYVIIVIIVWKSRQNIDDTGEQHDKKIFPHAPTFSKNGDTIFLRAFCLASLAALALEATVFNFQHYLKYFADPEICTTEVSSKDPSLILTSKDGYLAEVSVQAIDNASTSSEILFRDLNWKVTSIFTQINFVAGETAVMQIQWTDEKNTYRLIKTIHKHIPYENYTPIQPCGKVSELRLTFIETYAGTVIGIAQVALNRQIPPYYSGLRFIVVSLLFFVIFAIFNRELRAKLSFLGDSRKQVLLNFVYILFLLSLLEQFKVSVLKIHGYGSDMAEFLVNYQGGFVRRGLTGEILFFLAQNFHFNVEWAIKIFCAVCLIAVCVFFVRSFQRKGYSLYILPLCFFLGSGILIKDWWIRKDYMFLCFFISILHFYKSNLPIILKLLIINIWAVFIILSHEVFAFFSIPILFLMFFNEYKNKGIVKSITLSFLCLAPSISAFLLAVFMHGNEETAQIIWNSWITILNLDTSSVVSYSSMPYSPIKAIGWTTDFVVKKHLGMNFFTIDHNIVSLVVWAVTFPVVYYIVTNALLVFRKNDNCFTDRHKTILSSVLIFQLLCLLPIFGVLSCDYIRAFFYWIASSFAIFLLIPIDNIEKLFPKKFVNSVERINGTLVSIMQPSKTNLVFLMLFIGITPASFIIEESYQSTMLYNIFRAMSVPFVPVIDNIIIPFLQR